MITLRTKTRHKTRHQVALTRINIELMTYLLNDSDAAPNIATSLAPAAI